MWSRLVAVSLLALLGTSSVAVASPIEAFNATGGDTNARHLRGTQLDAGQFDHYVLSFWFWPGLVTRL
jgi:hypothetical protein